MGMSLIAKAFISPDDSTYQLHKDILKACARANVSLPKETAEYFGNSHPEEYLLEEKLEIEIPFKEWENDSMHGYDILIKDIPQGVYKIRVYCSW